MQTIEIEWRGEATLPEISEALNDNGRVDLVLPANFNHALFAHLYPGTTAGAEEIDIQGGPELLHSVARVDGLDDLLALKDLAETVDARIHIISPPRLIMTRGEAASPA
ncbi:MAG: hypothetical protein WCZ87_04725 [Thiohalobacteraceae bacterium]